MNLQLQESSFGELTKCSETHSRSIMRGGTDLAKKSDPDGVSQHRASK